MISQQLDGITESDVSPQQDGSHGLDKEEDFHCNPGMSWRQNGQVKATLYIFPDIHFVTF